MWHTNRNTSMEANTATMEHTVGEPKNSTFLYNNISLKPTAAPESNFEKVLEFYLNNILVTLLCIIGVIGNSLNLLVLTRRRLHAGLERLEQGAHLGLTALAVSDLLFCLTALPRAFLEPGKLHSSKSFALYYSMIGPCLLDIWIKTSTWLTVLLAISRYAAICHPMRGKYLVHITFIRLAIGFTFLFWILLHLPMFWSYTIDKIQLGDEKWIYFRDYGPYLKNPPLKTTFTYIFAVLGFFVPVIILILCNINLIWAVRESERLRRKHVRGQYRAINVTNRVTLTLIIIFLMLVLLILPSELVRFCQTISPPSHESYSTTYIALVVTNVLQAINFSFNFFLYCTLNSHFRNTLRQWLLRKEQVSHRAIYRYAPTQRSSSDCSTRSIIRQSAYLGQGNC